MGSNNRVLQFVIFGVITVLATGANADLSWTLDTQGGSFGSYSSACTGHGDLQVIVWDNFDPVNPHFYDGLVQNVLASDSEGPFTVNCIVNIRKISNNGFVATVADLALRGGSGCTLPLILDSNIGSCVTPPGPTYLNYETCLATGATVGQCSGDVADPNPLVFGDFDQATTNSICGQKNGILTCIEPTLDPPDCGTVNGVWTCVTPLVPGTAMIDDIDRTLQPAGCGFIDIGNGSEYVCTDNGTGNQYNNPNQTEVDTDPNSGDSVAIETFDYVSGSGNGAGTEAGNTEGVVEEVSNEAGDEQCIGDHCDWGGFSGGSVSDNYTPGSDTIGGVWGNFTGRLSGSLIVGSASGFFVSDVSGTCPIWVLSPGWVFPDIPIDAQCSSVMLQIWPLISAIIIATAGFVAFRWAFL